MITYLSIIFAVTVICRVIYTIYSSVKNRTTALDNDLSLKYQDFSYKDTHEKKAYWDDINANNPDFMPRWSEALAVLFDNGYVSTRLLQDNLINLKYGDAARLIDTMERKKIIEPPNDPEHTTKFQNIISDIKEANKQIKYSLGYSNISFELWLILHKEPCNKQFISPKQYLPILNRTFDEDFQALKEYKKEDNFKRCLSKLSLDDVKQAIKHANDLMKQKEQDCTIIKYKGIKYYKDNPALNVHEHIQKILEDCEIL